MIDREDYKEWIANNARNHSSRIILALDLEGESAPILFQVAESLVNKTAQYLCGVRFGRQTVLNLGPRMTRRLTRTFHRINLPCIIDDKLSDIGTTNAAIARSYYGMGFDAIIVNPSSGWEAGLEPVYELSHANGHGVILLVYMSHPGAKDTFGQRIVKDGRVKFQYEKYARRAVEWRSDGAVIGATRPGIIRKLNPVLD
ncbi:MAG TPA: orotidine 5'-phosphate decarboxylase / HUMPS family protein, partial [Candidatus Binatus sp.]|nr:orotidine 5'-phosphate decarboxylase / HUMPS family protein [Candidatus Binatus sp.]